jgi:hypothetical protein
MWKRKNKNNKLTDNPTKTDWRSFYKDKKEKIENDVEHYKNIKYDLILSVIEENFQKFEYNNDKSNIELITDRFDIYIKHSVDSGFNIEYRDIDKNSAYIFYKYKDKKISNISKLYFQ